MKKGRKFFQIAFLVVGALTVCEFLFVRGLFSWLIAVAAVAAMGLVNAALAAKDRDWNGALLYILSSVALCMGYFVLPV